MSYRRLLNLKGIGSAGNNISNSQLFVAHSRAAYSSLPDSDILHRSRVPTDHFQQSLPRLPIPDLEKTCQRYIAAQTPLLTAEELANTSHLVEDFKNGPGKGLHEELVAKDKQNKNTSYISGPWFDMYLKDRRAVALNHNPFMAFKDDERLGYNDQLIRSTNFVISSVRFMKTLRANILKPEVYHLNPAKSDNAQFENVVRWLPKSVSWYGAYLYKAFPLDMSQFSNLFNTNRIPRPEKDEIFHDPSGRHLLVMRKGNFYTLEVVKEDGSLVPDAEIYGGLKAILENSDPPAEYPLGIISSQDRDFGTSMRQKLEQAGNQSSLHALDSALFCLSLDDTEVEDPTELSRTFLHGDGCNRWFDKSFSLIITGNGKSCVNMEHSWGDGVAVLRYFNEIYKDSMENTRVHPGDGPDMSGADRVNKLEFNLTDDVKQGIRDAKSAFAKTVSNLDLSYIQHQAFGKDFIKQQKFSPDAFMQFGIQLAHFRYSGGRHAATYESCSTSAFKHGRTETIRSCTSATRSACELFEKAGTRPSPGELRAALDECSRVHGELTKEAAMGQGFDRHLFCMKAIAASRGEALPALYQDPAYARLNHVVLSTSTLTSPALVIGGFAPVVPDGFGIGYGINDDNLGYIVTAYPPHQDVHGLLDCMKSAVQDMHTVFEGRDFK